MHHWAHINRQKLQKLIREQRIMVNEQMGHEEVDYDQAVGVADAELIRENYPSNNCGEILGRRIRRRR